MITTVARISNIYAKNVMKTGVRNGSRFQGGTPGESMPFNIHNKAWVTFHFTWFGLTGIGAPFLIMLYMMAKK